VSKRAIFLKWLAKILLLLFLIRIGLIPIQIAISQHQAPHPQAIFVLGGDREREQAAAKLAQAYPQLPIWISSGSSPDWTKPHFQKASIPLSRLHLDYCAVDTVTNFTCLVDELKQQQIHHVYLLTSDFHLPRAQVIGFFVFGSQNIAITPIGVPSRPSPEPWVDTLRDTFRSIVWIFTGRSFLRFHPRERQSIGVKIPLKELGLGRFNGNPTDYHSAS
jgi:uncharacterized SAM-binding protein YcdF (DUF218 family)